jgi:hypothetical protein
MRLWISVCAIAMCASMLAPTSARAATIAVPAGGDLQAALNAAQPGDVVTLAAGAVYTGNFILPNKGPITGYITVRSDAPDSVLPPDSVRLTPAFASQLPKIKSPSTSPALATAPGANHWRLMFLEFQANKNGSGDIISIGAGDATQTQLSQVPYAFILDRLYVHGDPVTGQKRGIALHSKSTAVINSWVSDCKSITQEAQAIAGFNGPGDFVIENNYLEGSTQSVIFGGADPLIPNLITSNIVFRHNHLKKQLAWRDPMVATPTGVTAGAAAGSGSLAAGTYVYKVVARGASINGTIPVSAPSAQVSVTTASTGGVTISWTPVAGAVDYRVYGRTGTATMFWTTTSPFFTDSGAAGTAGTPPSKATTWMEKNAFELKNAQDVTIEGNVFENVWFADQRGYAIMLTPRNQGGTAPWVIVQRVTVQNNLVRHAPAGVNILGQDLDAVGNPTSQLTNHITVRNNIFDDLNVPTWGPQNAFPNVFQLGAGPKNTNFGPDTVTIDHNTVIFTDGCLPPTPGQTLKCAGAVVWLYSRDAAGQPIPIPNFSYTNNVAAHNTLGMSGDKSSSGLTALSDYAPGSIVAANVLAGGDETKYPAGNYFPPVADWQAGFVNYAASDYHLLPTSPFKNRGTDAADLGADPDPINAAAAIALSGDNRTTSGPTPIRITPTTLPHGRLNEPYREALTCVGGSGACNWQLASGTLPSGLAFDTTNGMIAGTPTAVETGSITVTAYDSTSPSNSATAMLTVTIDPPPFALKMPAAPQGQVGVPYQLTPSVSGALGTVSWTIASGSLPPGIALDALSGAISGTPTLWGTTTAVVQAQDSWSADRVASQPLTITIAPAPLVVATTALPHALLQTLYQAALSASGGTGSNTWSLIAGALPAGLTLDASGTISGTPTELGTFTFTVNAVDNNWPTNTATGPVLLVVDPQPFAVSIPVAPTGQVGVPYQLTPTATGQLGTVSWTLAAGALPAGLTLDPLTGTIAGTPTEWGSFNVTVRGADSFDPINRVSLAPATIVIAPTPLVITTSSLANAIYQQPYSATLVTSGGTGNATWSVVGGALPSGIGLASTGLISGTPSVVGTFTVTVQATDANWATNTATAPLTLVVIPPSFTASMPPPPAGRVGVPYLATGAATNGAVGVVTWTIAAGSGLPVGLALDGATGAIAGTPTAFGSVNTALVAHDSFDASRVATVPISISIAPSQIVVATTSLPKGSIRVPYHATLAANGGTGVTTWAVVSGSLPKGLTLSPAGEISGTPKAVGTATFMVQASDAGWAGNVATRSLSIRINAREIVLRASDATNISGTWSLVSDSTAADGVRIWNPNLNVPKLGTPLAHPTNYFEVTFEAEAGIPYHFWLRGKADNNYWGNDSVMIQFDHSVDANGTPIYRIGTTTGGDVNLEDCSGCGDSRWGWQDNGWGVNVFGPNIYFAQPGPQTLRVQIKEDGFSIDQIVLSAIKYLTSAPGTLKNDATIVNFDGTTSVLPAVLSWTAGNDDDEDAKCEDAPGRSSMRQACRGDEDASDEKQKKKQQR